MRRRMELVRKQGVGKPMHLQGGASVMPPKAKGPNGLVMGAIPTRVREWDGMRGSWKTTAATID